MKALVVGFLALRHVISPLYHCQQASKAAGAPVPSHLEAGLNSTLQQVYDIRKAHPAQIWLRLQAIVRTSKLAGLSLCCSSMSPSNI